MSLVQELEVHLRDIPNVRYTRGSGSITIVPEDRGGFTISVRESAGPGRRRYRVAFNRWHAAFETESDALDCVAAGLSGDYRLRVTQRGGRPFRWTLEGYEEGLWRVASTITHPIHRFWGAREVLYLKNRLTRRGRDDA
jgi:hypothetical protein